MATQIRSSFFLALFLFAATLVPPQLTLAQEQSLFREKQKLVGIGFQQPSQQGYSVAASGDGNTAILGGPLDSSGIGAAWVFTVSSSGWNQQGKLVASDAFGNAEQGWSVALSSDGNTALVGGPGDNGNLGAAWVFTSSNGVWTEQGKLVASDAVGNAEQGWSVALSSDGNTALVGGPGDNGNLGAAWVFTRSNGVWTERSKLVGTGALVPADQGFSVALSVGGDGYTALVGGPGDNGNLGAAWVFTSSNGGVWKQQGSKLVGTGGINAQQGISVALAANNGNTALVGGFEDNGGNGAAWILICRSGRWTQQGSKLVGTGLAGRGVALSGDGNTAIVGAPGAGVRVYFRTTKGLWMQQGSIITGTGSFGQSVSLSGLGRTLLIGAPTDTGEVGAAWVYVASQN
jgi:FG-GAP repeat